MLRKTHGHARQPASPQQTLRLFALAIFLLPWVQFAQAGPQQHVPQAARAPSEDTQIPSQQHSAATPIEAAQAARHTYSRRNKQDAPPAADKSTKHSYFSKHNKNENEEDTIHRDGFLDDASALATLAPAQSVRAPRQPRHNNKPSSLPTSGSGLASQQIARSLDDWEVEDFVLLATVDGDLYASDRKTGVQRWHLEVDLPMVETTHFRTNNSVLDEDYHPVDHYIWAVEPNRDGGLYVWIPDSNAGVVRTGFTMKKLVEELAPYADEDPPVVYTGDKKTTMITLDAATGRVLKWFGAGGSMVTQDESCLKPNALLDNEECSSMGTITLGRTEYTVGIQRRDGRPIATLRYSEWTPNNFDSDLYQQYHVSLDGQYITSQHDGKVYAFDYDRAERAAPLFSHKFSAPVARVFDVCRPWDAPSESNPELIVLPQPAMPSQDEHVAHMRRSSIFLNQTSAGSWYAMSGRSYPLIIDAPVAQISRPDWWDMAPAWDTLNQAKVSKALIGTHFLESPRYNGRDKPLLTLPPGSEPGSHPDPALMDPDNDSMLPVISPEQPLETNIITKVKSLPQTAANSVIDFVSNPVLIIIFVIALIYNEHKLRRSYNEFLYRVGIKEPRTLETSISTNTTQVDAAGEEADANARGVNLEGPEDAARVAAAADVAEGQNNAVDLNNGAVNPVDNNMEPNAQAAGGEVQDPDGERNGGVLASPEKRKKAHRGRRGGANRKKGKKREVAESQDDANDGTMEDAIDSVQKMAEPPNNDAFQPDAPRASQAFPDDPNAVTPSVVKMGNIEVNTDEQLGSGSNGTLVFSGKFDGRDVAVKRMLIQFYDIASQETRLLRESDDHPNVVRYYAQQTRDGFLYIALERCAASLAEIVERPHLFRDLANAGRMDVPNVLYQVTNGLNHLHELRIVHRDLKPQNILVNMGKNGKPRLLVSDFGLCKKLEGGQSSFGATTGRAAGTSGWRAPELLLDEDARDSGGMIDATTHSGSGSVLVADGTEPGSRRATRAIDIFSLGLVFFYVLTNGSHPFDCGDRYMREVNIRKGQYNLRLLDSLGDFAYEAKDLVASMLQADPRRRPNSREIMAHPFFWSPKKRLSFLCDVSDHFEKEPRDPPSEALLELERHAPDVTRGDFLRILPRDFVDSLGKQRKYTGSRLLDLLRALRNKKNHYEDMSESLKRSVGPLPEGYLSFWTFRFPMLLLVCWNAVYNVRWDDSDRFREYYEPAGL